MKEHIISRNNHVCYHMYLPLPTELISDQPLFSMYEAVLAANNWCSWSCRTIYIWLWWILSICFVIANVAPVFLYLITSFTGCFDNEMCLLSLNRSVKHVQSHIIKTTWCMARKETVWDIPFSASLFRIRCSSWVCNDQLASWLNKLLWVVCIIYFKFYSILVHMKTVTKCYCSSNRLHADIFAIALHY